MSRYATVTRSSTPSAKSPRPEPRITPTSGGCGSLPRSHSAAAASFESISCLLAHQNAGDRRRHEAHEGTPEERPESEPCEIGLARGREAVSYTHLTLPTK